MALCNSLTVFHNGILIQDNVELWGGTEWLQHIPYKKHDDRLPLSLQDHAHPVRYRNIWVRDLERPAEAKPVIEPEITLTEKEMKNYTGTYLDDNDNKYIIVLENGKLHLKAKDRIFDLIIHSKKSFSTTSTAIYLTFTLDKSGKATEMIYEFTGTKTKTTKE
jgi:hypothetical protein